MKFYTIFPHINLYFCFNLFSLKKEIEYNHGSVRLLTNCEIFENEKTYFGAIEFHRCSRVPNLKFTFILLQDDEQIGFQKLDKISGSNYIYQYVKLTNFDPLKTIFIKVRIQFV